MGKFSIKLTTDEFKKEVENITGLEYSVLSEYNGTNTKISMRHNICNHEYEVTPSKFKQGRRCPNCNSKKKKTTDSFKKEIELKKNGEYEVLGEYINKNTKILIKHKLCGHIFEGIPTNLIRTNNPTGCPLCNGNKQYTNEEFNKLLKYKTNNEFDLVGDYKNNKTYVKIKHNLCGNILERKPTHIQQRGIYCQYCNMTKGEEKIKKYLLKENLLFSQQFTFDNLKNKQLLKFDFMVKLDNKLILIEYDGEFHFDEVNFIKEKFPEKNENSHINDTLKNNFCIENKIQLLRIPYWSFDNIENILDDILKKVISSTTISKESTIEAYWKQEASYLLI